MKFLRLLPVLILLFAVLVTKGQDLPKGDQYYKENPEWRKMMKDENVNLKAAKKAFKLYMEDRKHEKGIGWKVFERWAYQKSFQVDEEGYLLPPDRTQKAYQKFIAENKGRAPLGEWEHVGPQNLPSPLYSMPSGLGRINAVAFHPNNPEIMFAGAPSGGLWKTTDGGETWISTTDNLPTLGVSAIVVSNDNPNEIYIGTGDRDAADAAGLGVFKSVDGGNSWKPFNEGMGNNTVNRMLQNPQNPNMLIAGTSSGVYITYNRGESWIHNPDITGDVWDMEYKPGDTTIVYAARGGNFYRSTDGGVSFNSVSMGTGSSRTAIAVTPANPNLVYCTLASGDSFGALVKSSNSGASFVVQSDSPNILGYEDNGSDNGGQAWYDLCMAVSPVDEDVVVVGGINVWKSSNGGQTWSLGGHWTGEIHADQHAMAYSPLNGHLYIGNDGGFYRSTNDGSTFSDLSDGLHISQIYKIGQSAQTKDLVITGHQDNGTSTFTSSGWSMSIGGDGMECLIDYTNDLVRYGEVYYGKLFRTKNGSNYSIIAPPELLGSDGSYPGLWVTPFCLNEFDPEYMYIGYNDLWRADNIVYAANQYYVNWENITSDISYSGKISVVEASPSNENIFYFATENKRLYVSTNINDLEPEWSLLSGFSGATIHDMDAHPNKDSVLYLALNNGIFVTNDLGENWINITENLPDVTYTSVVFDPQSNEGIYVGSKMGIFYRSNNTKGWVYYANEFPLSAHVTELEIYSDESNPEESRLRAATYGRGLWESPLYANSNQNDIMVSLITVPSSAEVNDNYTPEVTVKNMGANSAFGFTVSVQINGGQIYTESVTSTISQFDEVTVSFPEVTLTGAGENIVVGEVAYSGSVLDESPRNNVHKVIFDVSGSGLPSADFAASSLETNTNTNITFEGTVDGDATGYVWIFGEGAVPQTATGIGPHDVSYSTGGRKDVVLKVATATDSVFAAKQDYITVYSTPVIVEQPLGTTLCQSEDYLLHVDAIGGSLQYQWKKDGVEIGGATMPSFVFSNSQPDQSGSFSCVVTNPAGAVETDAVDVTINPNPTVNVNIDNDILCEGESANIEVSGGDSYLWSDDLGTSSSVTVSPDASQSYFVTVTSNGCNTITEVPILVPTGITVTPSQSTVDGCEGEVVTLSVDAEGEALQYQWYFEGTAIEGAVDFAYSIANASEDDNGSYVCEVSNRCFTEESSEIMMDLSSIPNTLFSYEVNGLQVQFYNLTVGADSYLWQFQGGVGTSTEESPTVTFPAENEYLAKLIATNDCGEDEYQESINLSSIFDFKNNTLLVQPNPNKGTFQVIVPNEAVGRGMVQILDANGKVVYSKHEILNKGKMEFTNLNLNSGLYMVILQSGTEKYTARIVVD